MKLNKNLAKLMVNIITISFFHFFKDKKDKFKNWMLDLASVKFPKFFIAKKFIKFKHLDLTITKSIIVFKYYNF